MHDPIAAAEHRIRRHSPALPLEAELNRRASFRAAYLAAVSGNPATERCALGFAVKAARELTRARILAGGGR